MKNDTGFDYEYFYKDHQQNTRLTYGLLKETASYRATMENPPSPSTLSSQEESQFLNINNTTRYTNTAYNYTKSSRDVLSPDKSFRTNGNLGVVVGPAKMLTVATGDKISMEVFAIYNQPTGNPALVLASTLISAVTGSFAIPGGEKLASGFTSNVPVVPNSGGASSTLPKAYLAYLFFNDTDDFGTSGAISISTSAFNAFEKLQRSFTADRSGKIFIYVANETNVSTGNVL